MQGMLLRIVVAATLILATGPTAWARHSTAIVVTPGGAFATNYCATMCAPHYKIWNGRLSCSSRYCACGCIRPNTTWPPARFYEVY
jgi:hypothetical protein